MVNVRWHRHSNLKLDRLTSLLSYNSWCFKNTATHPSLTPNSQNCRMIYVRLSLGTGWNDKANGTVLDQNGSRWYIFWTHFNIKTVFQVWYFHNKNKTVVRPSYLYVRICSMQIPFKLSPRFGMPGPDDPASAMHFEALTGVSTRTPPSNQTTAPPSEISSETPPGNPTDLTSLAPALNAMLTQPEGLGVAALLSILSTNQPAAKSSPIDNGKGLTFDPFMFSNQKACIKLSDMRDFVTVTQVERRGGSSSGGHCT